MAIIPTDKTINIVQATKDFASSLGAYIKSNLIFKKDFPVGSIIMIPSAMTIPTGWLQCSGASISSSTYPDLYTALGNSTTLPTITISGTKVIIKAL